MPSPILTVAELRAAEARAVAAGTSVGTLMTRAGAAVAEAVAERWPGRDVLVACGPGNNGGDGYVAARLLAERGFAVRVAALREPRGEAAIAARRGWTGPVEPFGEATPDAAVLVDALFGIGLKRPLKAAVAGPLARLGHEGRVAVDLPSGVDADGGAVMGALRGADLTVALGALKPAHRLRPAADLCGETIVAEIGLVAPEDPRLVSVERPSIAAPGYDANKYTRGKVVVVGGAMPGAAMLAATAAQRSGAGYITLLGESGYGPPHALVRQPWSEHALDDERIGAVVCGPGLGHDDGAREKLAAALATPHPLVLDADALTLTAGKLERIGDRTAPTILTPHEGEFARLFGPIGTDRLAAVRAAAATAGALVLLKGAATIIACPDGRAAINPLSPPWLASAGTGDVLSGILGTMFAQAQAARWTPFAAAHAAVWLHAEAARQAGPALIADDLVTRLRHALAACL